MSLTVSVGVVHQPLPAPNLVGRFSRAKVYSIMKSYQLYFTTSGPGAFERYLEVGRGTEPILPTP